MCVICYSPAGIEPPTEKRIKKLFEKNPDGAGFAIDRGDGKVEYHKGYMQLEALMEALKKAGDLKSPAFVLHCRITTKGKTDAKTCHPFTITKSYKEMTAEHAYSSRPVMFHNGTFTGLGGVIDKNASDTQDFAAGPAFLMMKGKRGKVSSINRKMFDLIRGTSKVLFVRGNGNPDFYGEWEKDVDGCFYSNTRWKEVSRVIYNSTWYSQDKTSQYPLLAGVKTEDDFGRISTAAWMKEGAEWLEFQTEKIREIAYGQMTKSTDELRGVCYKHVPSGNTYFPIGEKGLVTEKGLEKLISWWSHKTKTDVDVIKSYLEDGLFQFANQNAMLTITKYFAQLPNSEGYRFLGDEWYEDVLTASLYSARFLKEFYGKEFKSALNRLIVTGSLEELDEDTEDIQETVWGDDHLNLQGVVSGGTA